MKNWTKQEVKNWTKQEVIDKLNELRNNGFLPVTADMFRKDDGVVGQILERQFKVKENNLHFGDLGDFELKGMRNRKSKSNLTLFHKKPVSGMSVIQIFNRFGYVKVSNRDPDVMKKKLFTTIRGGKLNSLGLMLKANSASEINLYYKDEYLATWDLDLTKIGHMILAFADTRGNVNTIEEEFHFTEAYMMTGINDITSLINDGILVMDLCVDQPLDSKKGPHDRGPHLRISVKKLNKLYSYIEQLM
jgi:hypothetical protein